MPRSLLPPEIKTYAAEKYLAGATPRELVTDINSKFGITVRNSALRQWLTRSGLGTRRKQLDAKTCAIVSSATVDKLARVRAAEPKAQLEQWAERTVGIADKALDFADSTGKPRDLASAVSAASTAVRLYRACLGIDGQDAPRKITFDLNFASLKPVRVVSPDGEVRNIVSPPGTTSESLAAELSRNEPGWRPVTGDVAAIAPVVVSVPAGAVADDEDPGS